MIAPGTRRLVFWVTLLGALALLLLPLALRAGEPDQAARWNDARIRPEKSVAIDCMVAKYRRLAPRYELIERMRANGVPAPVLFCLHQRESDGNFLCHPHEGSPLQQRTRDVPKGRLPAPAQPPFSFEQSAEDAYYVCDRLDLKDWHTPGGAMQAIESFNGLGYQKRGIPSPYLWAGTTVYIRGKYVKDGKFDPFAVDKQLGAAAILLRMRDKGIPLRFLLTP